MLFCSSKSSSLPLEYKFSETINLSVSKFVCLSTRWFISKVRPEYAFLYTKLPDSYLFFWSVLTHVNTHILDTYYRAGSIASTFPGYSKSYITKMAESSISVLNLSWDRGSNPPHKGFGMTFWFQLPASNLFILFSMHSYSIYYMEFLLHKNDPFIHSAIISWAATLY